MNNSLVCVDASIIVDLLTHLGDDPHLQALWEEWLERGVQLVAPHLLPYEVTNVLYKKARRGEMSYEAALDTLQTLVGLPIALHSNPILHSQALQIAQELSLGATYDPHYLALAAQLGCEFWTRNGKLFRAAREKYDLVRLLG